MAPVLDLPLVRHNEFEFENRSVDQCGRASNLRGKVLSIAFHLARSAGVDANVVTEIAKILQVLEMAGSELARTASTLARQRS